MIESSDYYWTALHLKFIYFTALYLTVPRLRPKGEGAPSRVIDGTVVNLSCYYSRVVQCIFWSVVRASSARPNCE